MKLSSKLSSLYRSFLWKIGIMDVLNYFYIWKVIKRERTSPKWKKYKINHDWVGRIYFVYSLRPEDEGEQPDAKEILVIDGLRQITNDYLDTIGLNEVVRPRIIPIEGTISYLVVLSPLFYQISRPIYIFSLILISISAYFGWIQKGIDWIIKFGTNLL